MPSPQRAMRRHALPGGWQEYPVSMLRQSALQPSPPVVLPSSHASAGLRVPSPQPVGVFAMARVPPSALLALPRLVLPALPALAKADPAAPWVNVPERVSPPLFGLPAAQAVVSHTRTGPILFPARILRPVSVQRGVPGGSRILRSSRRKLCASLRARRIFFRGEHQGLGRRGGASAVLAELLGGTGLAEASRNMTPNISHARWQLHCHALAVVAIALGGLGCKVAPAPSEPSREARAEAAQIFRDRCANCHGPLGKADGPRAAKLSRPPRNFADPVWQLAVSDRHLEQVILGGGASVGKSSDMPPNPDLANKPEVMVALRQHLRVLAYTP